MAGSDQDAVAISIVIPVYNEVDNVVALATRLADVLRPLAASYQVLFVDDGSRDGTADAVCALASDDACVELLRFTRNFGHQAALTAGLSYARGDVVITLDGDLQHPPELIPRLLALHQQGSDIVYTVRRTEERLTGFKRFTSVLFYRVFNRLSPVRILEASSDFRLMSRRAVDAVLAMPERHRFLRGMIPWTGLRSSVLPFDAPARRAGTTKFSGMRMVSMAFDAAFSFSRLPLQLATLLGLLTTAVCLLYLLVSLVSWWMGVGNVTGWTSLIATVLFIGGVQLVFIGLLGEYVGRIYEEVKQRPLYVVQEHIRCD